MKLPKQVAPVKRPSLVQPHTTVDVVHGDKEYLTDIRLALLSGANFNDPAPFAAPVYSPYGYHILSRIWA
ncbi:MAG: cyanobactin biosynthesis system PatB/AcyB/McaB family protein [Microcoleus sp.]